MAFGLLSAGISGVGSVLGGVLGSSAAKRAAKQQKFGYNQSLSALKSGVADAGQIMQGWSDRGAGAASLIDKALGNTGGRGGISQSGIASKRDVLLEYVRRNPKALENAQREVQNSKSQYYGLDPLDFLEKATETDPDGYLKQIEAELGTQSGGRTQPTQSVADGQAEANDIFLSSNYGKNVGDTYEGSRWQEMSDRATTKANDLFLGLAGADGSVLSGNTARGLQENQAFIDDKFHGEWLSNYNNGFDRWLASLSDVAGTGFSADSQMAGVAANAGSAAAGVQQNAGQAAANGTINSANSWSNALEGVFNSLGQVVGNMGSARQAPPDGTQQKPVVNSLYLPGSAAGRFNLRPNRNAMMAG